VREILPPGARRRWFAGRMRRDATWVIAVSEAVAGWLRAEGLGARVEVVHNGVDIPQEVMAKTAARRALGLPGDGCVVVWLGQMLPHKGAASVVRAVETAVDRGSELRAVLAGSGPVAEVERLRRRIATGPHADRFHLLPAQDDVLTVLAAADVAAVTSLTPDPLPRTVLEAMAAGLPVVAFAVGGVPEMVVDEDTGLLVEAGDEEGLAARFARLAADPEQRRGLGAHGRERVRECFTVEAHVERVEAVLRRAAAR
jgi:glycosyltransferase involved in cell wall biosynthesis